MFVLEIAVMICTVDDLGTVKLDFRLINHGKLVKSLAINFFSKQPLET